MIDRSNKAKLSISTQVRLLRHEGQVFNYDIQSIHLLPNT
jgi:hypothetical protein